MANNQCVIFKYTGKYGHFLRAEANASAPSYPFPPRTALLGLLGAVMGFEKDTCQVKLEEANIAVSGRSALTHWHHANLRNDPPDTLSQKIKRNDKGTSKNQKNNRTIQEWLIRPAYTIYAQVPEPFHTELCRRIKNRNWYFSPCLGLSEMSADLTFVETLAVEPLPKGKYHVRTLTRRDQVSLNIEELLEKNMAAKSIRMPRALTSDRQFFHETYLYPVGGNTLPIETEHAVKAGDHILQWL
jgi:CRISPR-associated protein Cas5h